MTNEINYFEQGILEKTFKFFLLMIIGYLSTSARITDDPRIAPVLLLITSFLAWRYFNKKYKQQLAAYNPNKFGYQKISRRNVLFTIAIVVILLVFLYCRAFINTFLYPAREINLESINFPLGKTYFYVNSIIVIPFLEEVLFRGIFFNLFFNRDNQKDNILAISASTLLFAILHIVTRGIPVFYFFISALLSVLYMYTKDLKYPIFFIYALI